jgi:eukaryotic-like serine/threonine-protein kinase
MAIAASGAAGALAPRPAAARLKDRWDILIDMPLGELKAPTALAYAVEDQRSVGSSYFALIADPKHPIRGGALGLARMSKHTNVLSPVDFGTLDWPPAGQRCLAIIYERPAGGRLAPAAEQAILAWSEADIAERIIAGLLAGLRALSVEGMTHRGIRPSNIFFRDAARRMAVLGDCITAPPAAHQPAVYEPIESAMAIPSGRGNGLVADDLYALGVLCLHLSQGSVPGPGLGTEALIEEKIRRGSFGALAGEARLSPALLELVRGLLIDEPAERWTLQDVEHWLQGRRLSPKVISPAPRATRPFEFGQEQCFTARSLGRALARSGEQAVHAVRSHGLQVWLQRSLADKTAIEGVAQALADAEEGSSGNAGQDGKLVARVAIALDPAAPIRYRQLALSIDGFNTAWASALMAGDDMKLLAEILLARLPQFWCQRQPQGRGDFTPQQRDYERLRRVLTDVRPGFGIERIGYELNPGLPCLSPFVAGAGVYDLPDLLPALEAAASGTIHEQPIDRHVAAFIANRFKKVDDGMLSTLCSINPALRLLGSLTLLARLQAEHGPGATPALAQTLARQAPLLIARFRRRKTRERLTNELPQILADGNLARLLGFLDNAEEKQMDNLLFARATQDFGLAARAIGRCEQEREHLPEEAAQTASVIAAAFAMLIAIVSVMGSVLVFGRL